ncbi:MAG: phosphatidylserine decarboxylase family protein, partial [Proteobacteria bacterium]|nr:phosphatidylserine decarboxylase family protein [Pseudomonadota bacterium]
MNYPHPFIAREGWPFVAGAFAAALAITIFAGWAWSLFFWFIAFFVLQFFR